MVNHQAANPPRSGAFFSATTGTLHVPTNTSNRGASFTGEYLLPAGKKPLLHIKTQKDQCAIQCPECMKNKVFYTFTCQTELLDLAAKDMTVSTLERSKIPNFLLLDSSNWTKPNTQPRSRSPYAIPANRIQSLCQSVYNHYHAHHKDGDVQMTPNIASRHSVTLQNKKKKSKDETGMWGGSGWSVGLVLILLFVCSSRTLVPIKVVSLT